MIKLGLGIDEADEEVSDKTSLISSSLGFISLYLKAEGAVDDGEMPPLEGAEEDASRMEEVNFLAQELHVLGNIYIMVIGNLSQVD